MSETGDSATNSESKTLNPPATDSQAKASLVVRLIDRLSRARKAIVIIAGIGTVLGGLMGYWNTYQAVKGGAQSTAVGVSGNMAANTKRMSIVALPFVNLSGDPGQEYFADAITEDITTELSRIKGSFVIARNSAFTYKGKTADAKAIGKELGVRYILQGTVSRSDSGAKITAQLVDAGSGSVIWSDQLDVKKEQFDSIRREVTGRLAFTLKQEFIAAEVKRAKTERPKNLDAQDFAMQALAKRNNVRTAEDFDEAYKLYGRALELDPLYEPALTGQSAVITTKLIVFPKSFAYPQQLLAEAEKKATEAIVLEPNDALAHHAMGVALLLQGRLDEAAVEVNTALELDPNLGIANALKGRLFTLTGRPELGIEPNLLALSLSPREPRRYVWMTNIGQAYMFMGKYKECIEWYEKVLAMAPSNLEAHVFLAAAYAQLGNMDKAMEAKTRALKINPEYKSAPNHPIYNKPAFRKLREKTLAEGLRKAGFAEE